MCPQETNNNAKLTSNGIRPALAETAGLEGLQAIRSATTNQTAADTVEHLVGDNRVDKRAVLDGVRA